MKSLVLAIISILSFAEVDENFTYKCNYRECLMTLNTMLSECESPVDKAEVYWRLSRVSLMLGEEQTDKDEKIRHLESGIAFAELGKKSDPKNIQCHMWYCANVGRKCQTETLIEQAAAVPAMMDALGIILNEFNRTDCSEAWQALSEIYHHHPFKSDDSAINYARMAALNIPDDELRLSTYIYLAELLYKRGWSQPKRASQIQANMSRFTQTTKSNIEKYAYHDGSCPSLPWTESLISSISDKEEADAVLAYAKTKHDEADRHTPVDKKDFEILMKIMK